MSQNFTQPEEIEYFWMTDEHGTGTDTHFSEGIPPSDKAVMKDEFAKAAQDDITMSRTISWRSVSLSF